LFCLIFINVFIRKTGEISWKKISFINRKNYFSVCGNQFVKHYEEEWWNKSQKTITLSLKLKIFQDYFSGNKKP
jgi:hypothetical protein